MTSQPPDRAYQIRPADPNDAPSIASIYNHFVDAGGSTFDAEHWTPAYVLQQLQLPSPDAWFVATGNETESVIGWASVHRFSRRHGYRFSLESAIYVRPDAFGIGVGNALQRQLDSHCIQAGIHHLMAKIVTDNERSIDFHHRHGFETVGTQREVGNMTGDWINVTIMQKIFPRIDAE